ncbi:MAG: hypothetical protein DRO12_01965 [Thermoprotei archaeon]|nr:MAG: hypothetical protein DRO12_01965 [Thermoprotei archaeon]
MAVNVFPEKLLLHTAFLNTVEELCSALDPCRSKLLKKYLAIARERPSDVAVLLIAELCKEMGVRLPWNPTVVYRDFDEDTVREIRRTVKRIASLCEND